MRGQLQLFVSPPPTNLHQTGFSYSHPSLAGPNSVLWKLLRTGLFPGLWQPFWEVTGPLTGCLTL